MNDAEKTQVGDMDNIKVVVERIKDTDDVPLTITIDPNGDVKNNR